MFHCSITNLLRFPSTAVLVHKATMFGDRFLLCFPLNDYFGNCAVFGPLSFQNKHLYLCMRSIIFRDHRKKFFNILGEIAYYTYQYKESKKIPLRFEHID